MKRRDEVAVGILLTVTTIVLVIGTIWLLRGGLQSGYPLYTRFPWGQNLKQGQPVLLAGVTVGYVSDVELRPEGFLDVTMRINEDYQVPRNSTASVKPVGIFGDVAVALTPKAPSAQSFAPGDSVPATTGPAGIEALTAEADSISTSVHRITSALEQELIQAGALRDLRRTIASAAALSVQLQTVAVEQNRNLTATLAAYRRAATAIDSATIDSTMKNLRSTSASFSALAASLDTTSSRLNGVLAGLQEGRGSAGKLLTDTLLYRDVRGLVGSLDSLVKDLKKNPKRYINVRVF
ncbi:MAG TPA: MlaD family protein [Gemmatimonadaceae bacterium]|nr:MlaD family protein [Gemmatimonadaceae bacterium]